MEALYAAIRAVCSDETWSVGVRLARSGAVLVESRTDDELVARVRTLKSLAAPKVSLFLDDPEWSCDCGDRSPACEHVAATIIAVKLGAERPSPAGGTAESAPAHLAYRFSRRAGVLHFERGVAREGEFQVLEIGLEAASSGRAGGAGFVATRADLEVDVLLGSARRGPVPAGLVPKLFGGLARCADVRLDGRPVRVATTPVGPSLAVEDAGEGFRLRLVDPSGDVERFANGIARVGDELRPIREPRLTAREAEEYSRGRLVGLSDVADLVSRELPALAGRVPVEVRTARLPRAVAERPRIVLEVGAEGADILVVRPALVYGDPVRARIDGGRLVAVRGDVPLRDEPAERRAVEQLARVLGLTPGVPMRFEGDAAAAFARRLEHWEGTVAGEGLSRFALAPGLVPRVRTRDDGELDLEFEASLDGPGRRRRGPRASEVLDAWRRGQTGIVLPDGGWSPLPLDFLAKHGRLVADLLAAREAAGGRWPRSAAPDVVRLCEALEQPAPPEFARLRSLVEGFGGLPSASLADGLRDVLRSYQRHGADWLAFLRSAGLGALLADDMGLGKTIQALAAVRGRTLVVCPTSVLANWIVEAARFRPDLTVCRYHGPNRVLDPRADLTITSYALLRLDAPELAAVDWDAVILDEAQAIKNPDSRVARAAFELRAEFRVALTGTPVENRLDELWSLMQFTNPGLLGGLGDFTERCARPIADGDLEASARLRDRIRPFVLRRMKREVAPELPPRTEVVLHNELSETERAVYDAVRAATREEVVRKLAAGGNVFAALEALLRLRQAACHAGLLPGRDDPGSTKVDLLVETLSTVCSEGHRALVFSQWTALLDRIEPHLSRQGIAFDRLDGSTVDRAGVVSRFQRDDGPPVLLVSLRAGGTGLNLTAADHVFLVDPWWNPAVEEQAADRTHRIGQDRPVVVHRIVSVDTVEERILALQDRKRELANAVVAPHGAAGLTRDDLMALLE